MPLAYSLRADLLEELKSLVADGAQSRDDSRPESTRSSTKIITTLLTEPTPAW